MVVGRCYGNYILITIYLPPPPPEDITRLIIIYCTPRRRVGAAVRGEPKRFSQDGMTNNGATGTRWTHVAAALPRKYSFQKQSYRTHTHTHTRVFVSYNAYLYGPTYSRRRIFSSVCVCHIGTRVSSFTWIESAADINYHFPVQRRR